MSRPTGSKNAGDGITRADFAKLKGWSLTKVAEMCRSGLIPLLPESNKPMRTWKIDPSVFTIMEAAGKCAYEESENPPMRATDRPEQALNGQQTAAVHDYWVARAKKEATNAELAALKLREAQGDLLERDALEDALFEMARMIRDRMLAVADRVPPLVVGTQDERQVRVLIQREVQQALEVLCEELNGLAADAPDDTEADLGT